MNWTNLCFDFVAYETADSSKSADKQVGLKNKQEETQMRFKMFAKPPTF